jgi:nucleotide-binding universal stress UspA family protein
MTSSPTRSPIAPSQACGLGGPETLRRVLVGFDGSPHAVAALAEAIDLVQAANGRLTVITVAPEPSLWGVSGTYWAPVDFGAIGREVERGYQAMLDEAVETVPADVPVTKILKVGFAGPAILHEASRAKHDLIVMGSRGRGRLRSLLLGSVIHHVIGSSPVPVLVVHLSAATGGVGRWTVTPRITRDAHALRAREESCLTLDP